MRASQVLGLFRSALFLSAATVWAMPHKPLVVAGSVTIDRSAAHVLEIQASERAILNWKEFSIHKGECVRFLQPSSRAAVLNRVQSMEASILSGQLEANGRVYLLNPYGVIVQKGAVINTGAFVASTLDVLDDAFLKGGELSFRGDSLSAVVNYGTIAGYEGDVILLGRIVRNEGVMKAPKGIVALGVGQEILLKPEGKERLFIVPKDVRKKRQIGLDNRGSIEALVTELKADGNAYKLAVNQGGMIEANATTSSEGHLYLVHKPLESTTPFSSNSSEAQVTASAKAVPLMQMRVDSINSLTTSIDFEKIPHFLAPYTRAVFENLRNLKTYDALIFAPHSFLFGFESPSDLGESPLSYQALIPKYRNYMLKQCETLD